MRPAFSVQVIFCEQMNPHNRLSAKTGKAWQLYKVHCVVDLGNNEGRVCQLISNDPVQMGPHQVVVGIGEKDGRTVFTAESFVPVKVRQAA